MAQLSPSLFWNIWSSPHTQAFEVLVYLLKMSETNSCTWAAHVRALFTKYGLPEPISLLACKPWPHERWKAHTKIVVNTFHETLLRKSAAGNSKLRFLNVQVTGLSATVHPLLSWVMTTQDAAIVRPHIKMLSGDYPCFVNSDKMSNGEPLCKLCQPLIDSAQQCPTEDLVHLLTSCKATIDIRSRVLPDLYNLLSQFHPENSLLSQIDNQTLTQFLLDCTSLNLPNEIRLTSAHAGFKLIAEKCSWVIYSLRKERTRQLSSL